MGIVSVRIKLFFFSSRRRHTRYIGDWSSDVCSSDLDDVWLQVLVQAREALIELTFESLVGAKKVIIHLYNSTSPAQRRVVFGMSKEEIVHVAVRGAKWIQERLPRLKGTEVRLQYSPESFSA